MNSARCLTSTLATGIALANENLPTLARARVIGMNALGDTVGLHVDGKNATLGFYRSPSFVCRGKTVGEWCQTGR